MKRNGALKSPELRGFSKELPVYPSDCQCIPVIPSDCQALLSFLTVPYIRHGGFWSGLSGTVWPNPSSSLVSCAKRVTLSQTHLDFHAIEDWNLSDFIFNVYFFIIC